MEFKKTYSFLAMAFCLAVLVSCSKEEAVTTPEPQAAASFAEPIPDQFIVVYKEPGKMKGDPGLNKIAVQSKTEELLSRNQIAGAEILQVYSAALSGVTMKLTKDQAAKLRNSKEVAFVEQDQIVTLAKPEHAGGGDSNAAEERPYGITRVNGVTGTASGTAWIIDTGIDLDHPDLNVDQNRGFTAFTRGKDATFDDGNGHGSHVAGTVAAIDNEIGVIGVAPGATVVPVKVLDSRGSGSYSGVIAGVDYVAANASSGDVANMSLGGPVSDALDAAVVNAASKGIIFALAAGNDSEDAANHSPARAEGANIYTISAMDVNDEWAYFSNFGANVDYAAPGVSVKSTWKDGGYNTISGTSMASPHAAGVLLLGAASTDGQVIGDPDGNPDPIIVH